MLILWRLVIDRSLSDNIEQMRKLTQNEAGFIPMMISILVIIIAIIYFAWTQVAKAQQ